jgi:hypothetical protein
VTGGVVPLSAVSTTGGDEVGVGVGVADLVLPPVHAAQKTGTSQRRISRPRLASVADRQLDGELPR